ncbi:MAG: DUF4214 domain-containing protein [Lachnospiraceae bacterium]|nr:DUF4214 domain-containing protein [Lachnospiraceae bacterium]
MKQKRFLRILSVLTSLILFLSVLNIPALSVSADGIDGEPWIGAGENTEYVVPNSAAMDDFISNWYKVALGRDPYPSELKQWKKELTGGVTCGSRAAYGFIFSSEYQNKKKSNSAFVTDLYKLMLGRTPDAAGKADWVNQLKKGKSREQIFAGFANSAEYYKICSKLKITAGYWEAGYNPNQLNSVNMFVERLYKVCLGRIGDKDGQIDWVNKLIKGQITGSKCAHDFIFSEEYVKKKLSNGDYVKNLYKAFMGREYDQAGYNDWVNKLKKGMSRDEVFAGFANSTEFDNICKSYGINRGNYVPTDIGTYHSYKVGDIIKLGQYEQDGNSLNGKEDIEWQVLKVADNRVLVVSKYALDCQPYNTEYTSVTWETCTLRKWLNNDFYNTAFRDKEKSKIPSVTIENKDNPKYGTDGGNITTDKVFCLSLEEIESYFGDYNHYDSAKMEGDNQNLNCAPTQNAIDRGASYMDITEGSYNRMFIDYGYTREVIGRRGCWWWLRTPGINSAYACSVYWGGASGANIYTYVVPDGFAVRPAMWITY